MTTTWEHHLGDGDQPSPSQRASNIPVQKRSKKTEPSNPETIFDLNAPLGIDVLSNPTNSSHRPDVRPDSALDSDPDLGANPDPDSGASNDSRPDTPTDPGDEGPAATGAGTDEVFGYALVEGIAEDSKAIARGEADRLVKIAALYQLNCMEPLAPSAAALARAKDVAGYQRLVALNREDLTVREIMSRLYLGEYPARRLVRLALSLTTRLRGTLAALSEGLLDLRRAEIIEEHASPLAEAHYARALKDGRSPADAEHAASQVAAQVEAAVLEKAATLTPMKLHKALRRAIARIDPTFVQEQTSNDLKGRRVTHRTNPREQTGDLYARLGAAEAHGVYRVLDAYARAARLAGSSRSLHELRADVLTHLVLHGHLPDATSGPAGPVDIDTEDASIIPDINPNTADIYRETDTPPVDPWDNSHHHDNPTPADPTDDLDAHQDDEDHHGHSSTPAPENGPGQGDATGQGGRAPDSLSAGSPTGTGTPCDATTDIQSPCSDGMFSRSDLRAHVQITVGLETLLGLNEEPGELDGHGPVTADTARDLAFSRGSTWRRLVTDPVTGYLLDYGRKTYRPPTALADHVRARDVTCRTPTCDRPASLCDLDHVIAWPAGATSEPNLQCKCDRDHRFKHEGRWRHQISTDPTHPPGTIVLVSPTGHIYLSYPHRYHPPPKNPPGPTGSNSLTGSNSPIDPGQASSDDDPGPPF